MDIRVNVGCGATPTPGWLNYDNSPSVRLSRHRLVGRLLRALRLLDGAQSVFFDFCRKNDIRWADGTRRIPQSENSVAVIYASHMLEHLDRSEARAFLAEARRVLVPGGVLRLALPDLGRHVARYRASGDADRFMSEMLVCRERARGWRGLLKALLIGDRHHLWMYDARSLANLVASAGFVDVSPLPPGETGIRDPGALDLRERADESLYVEARKAPWPAAAAPTRAETRLRHRQPAAVADA